MEPKVAIITGVSGQDGSYLAELLLEKGYIVVGTVRRSAKRDLTNLTNIINHKSFIIDTMELADYTSVNDCILKYKPDEIYNLAAMSFVTESFKSPHSTFESNSIGVLNILETIRKHLPNCRLYQASTSEMFGKNYDYDTNINYKYQSELTAFEPQSPYAISKLAAHNLIKLYRQYGIKCCSGILFNHESPRRGKEFVTRKITSYIGELVKNCSIPHTGFGCQSSDDRLNDGFVNVGVNNGFTFVPHKLSEYPRLKLGNLESFRDWGFAGDYVRAMWLMLQSDCMEDYVIATGETHSIKEFCDKAFSVVGLDYLDYVQIDAALFRPAEVDYLCGNAEKARKKLEWKQSVSFDGLVQMMVMSDIGR